MVAALVSDLVKYFEAESGFQIIFAAGTPIFSAYITFSSGLKALSEASLRSVPDLLDMALFSHEFVVVEHSLSL